jgi:pentatricopeptide repeat protein
MVGANHLLHMQWQQPNTRCLEIFEEMIDAGCHPDGGTAKVLLSACSSEDQIEQVTTVIRTMHKGMEAALPA